ncbi:IS1096 element passenger TnpR family protein [Streptomyces wuyuanensis]|uniref:IS1096 element passenger TnpR family protein n=1 Tax=Streptomyces wuyuanensis TaxID=1196353 RepID=UPI003D7188AA
MSSPGLGRGPIRFRIHRPDGEPGFCDERTATLTALLKLGVRWDHLVAVEQFQTASAGLRHPHCADGAGACPPEDCGGGPGYRSQSDPRRPGARGTPRHAGVARTSVRHRTRP